MKQLKNSKSARLGLESLEDRRLMSSVILNGAAMELHGDANQSNEFLVRAASANRVLGFANNFGTAASLGTVNHVVIYTGKETDTVTVAAGVTAPVEVIDTHGHSTWLTAGTSRKFNAWEGLPSGTHIESDGDFGSDSDSDSPGEHRPFGHTGSGSSSTGAGSSSSDSGSSSTGKGSSSTGAGSSSSGTGSSSTGTGSSSTGTGSSSTGSGSSSTGKGSSSTGTGSSSTGTGSSSTGTGSSSTGTGSSSTGTGTSSTGTGSSSTGTGSSSTGTGSSSTGTGSSSTGSGSSSTGSGSGPTSNPTNPNDPATPTAVITLTSPSAILPLETVNVQAVASSFGNGTQINSTIAWNFGDPSAAYNNLVGFNAAHAYANAGTYTITLTITTPDGHVGVATKQVTISQDTRPTIYVAANGNDSNNGLSANSAIQSIARVNQLMTSNVRVLFRAGDTFTWADRGINVGSNHDVYVGSYGSGAKPILMYNGPANQGVFVGWSTNAQGVVVQGLTFDSIYVHNEDHQAIPTAFGMQGNGIVIRDNTFLNVLNDMAATVGGPTNVLVQDNSSPDPLAVTREYFYFVGGKEIVVVGNKVADSYAEAVLRVGGVSDLLIADNSFAELPQAGTGGGKNVLSIQEGSYAYIYGNTLSTGPVEVGPIGTPTQDPNSFFQYAVFDSNTLINGSGFNISPGAHHVMDKNNVIMSNGNTGFTINAQENSGAINWQVQDVYILHNTVIDSGMWGGFLSVNNGAAQGIHLDNNLFVNPTFETGFGEAFIKVDENNLDSFSEIKNNVWSVPAAISSYAQGGEFFVGSNVSDPNGWLSPTKWEATGVPTGDVYQNVNLGATYSVNINGSNAGSNLPKP